jgi:hypothetical protein
MTEPELGAADAPLELSELGALLAEISDRAERSFQGAARLAKAAMFWNIVLILAGALVAACGGLTNSLGSRTWLTAAIVALGVVTALGAAYQGFVKPRERGAQLAKLGLEYRALVRRAQDRSAELVAEAQRDPGARPLGLRGALTSLSNRVRLEVEELQLKEIDLYVGGTTNLGRKLAN